jgi:hypothetical protein
LFEKIINFDNNAKVITLVGSFTGLSGQAVVVLQKTPFDADTADWAGIFNTLETCTKTHDNDIYKKFQFLWANSDINSINSQVIYPAEPHIIAKYSKSEFCNFPKRKNF